MRRKGRSGARTLWIGAITRPGSRRKIMAENVAEVVTGTAVLAVAVGFLSYASQFGGFGGGGDIE